MMIKVANSAINKDWALVVDLGKEGDAQLDFERPPLSEPLAFFGGHEYGDKTYTNGADRDNIVAPKFRDTTFELLGGVKPLHLIIQAFGGRSAWLRPAQPRELRVMTYLALAHGATGVYFFSSRGSAPMTEPGVSPWRQGAVVNW